jgi:hypothetical protein
MNKRETTPKAGVSSSPRCKHPAKSSPLRHLPVCTPEADEQNDFIPYGLGVTTNGDQVVFNRRYGQLWRFHPDTGEIAALNPRIHIPLTFKHFFRTNREEIDWKALDRVEAEWGIRSW